MVCEEQGRYACILKGGRGGKKDKVCVQNVRAKQEQRLKSDQRCNENSPGQISCIKSSRISMYVLYACKVYSD